MANNKKILDHGPFFHGTKAALEVGDLLNPQQLSNYGIGVRLHHVYFSATLDAAIWGAQLAKGEEKERIYQVEPTGDFEDDPNLTDKKFPGNPTRSYRSKSPLRILSVVEDWTPHAASMVKLMKQNIEKSKHLENGGIIN